MNIILFLVVLIPVAICSNDEITLNLADERHYNVDISYYMSRLYLTPKPIDENQDKIVEVKWNDLFKFNIKRDYSLAYIILKPLGNSLLEIKIKLLEFGDDEFVEYINVIQFPEDYTFPNWLTLESPQFVNHIIRSMIDLELESLQGDVKIIDKKDFVKIKVSNTSFINKLSWGIFFSTIVIDSIFADTVKLIGLSYRRIKIIAYNSLTPNLVQHLTTITFPEDYFFPYWFTTLNGCFYKLVTNKLKEIHFGILSHRLDEELIIHKHVNMYHVYIKPEYFGCVAVKSMSLYTFMYRMPSEFDSITDIFIRKQLEEVELSMALAKKDNPLKKITIKLPYSNEIKSDWENALDAKKTSSDDLIALNLDLSSSYLPIQIQMAKEMNNYTLTPTFSRISRIVSVSRSDVYYHLVRGAGEITKVTISYPSNRQGRMKIEAIDKDNDRRFERQFLFNENKFASFIENEPKMPNLPSTST